MCEFLVVFTIFCRGRRTSGRLLLYSSDAANSQYTRMDSSDVASCQSIEMGEEIKSILRYRRYQSMTNNILCCMHVHHSLKMQLRLPSSNRDKIICFHEPCNQFMRKSAEAFFAVDRKQKTNHRRENSFPLDIRILVVMVMLHRHTCCRAV